MRAICTFVSMLALALSAGAQPYSINTFAGGGLPPTPMAATSANVIPLAVATDSASHIYFTSTQAVFKIDSTGQMTRVAGAPGGTGTVADGGQATGAYLNQPNGLAVDSSGNLYVAESGANRVRKITPAGIISTVAGIGTAGFSGDGGPAAKAQLRWPVGLAFDSAGDLYIADWSNGRVRKVSAAGTISTVAGNGGGGYTGDGGPATSAQIDGPISLAIDSAGDLYIADASDSVVRKVNGAGIISTVAGGGKGTTVGVAATSFALNYPDALALDANGDLYIADSENSAVYKVTTAGIISAVAGNGNYGYSGDGGAATSAELNAPYGLAFNASGDLYIGDYGNYTVRKVNAAGTISTVAGTGAASSGDGGPAASISLNYPINSAVDAAGNLYIAEDFANRVRKVTPAGIISTVAGAGSSGFSGDGGPATSAQLWSPRALAIDATGNLYIADTANNRIRKVTPAGIISTVAGNGNGSFSGDGGLAIDAGTGYPEGVAVDSSGNLYISDNSDCNVRKVTPAGIISTVAGTGKRGYSGDGGPATSAQISFPEGIAVDESGNLYIADPLNNRVRKVTPAGIISTVVGNGTAGHSGDGGPATSATIYEPFGVAVDASGNIYVVDEYSLRVRKVTPDGTISTIAGTGAQSYTGDGGPALSATFGSTNGVAVDLGGRVYVSDASNGAIRMLAPPAAEPTISSGGVVPVYSAVSTIQPGEWVSIYGENLASATTFWKGDFPTSLGGTSVTIDGKPAYLWYVGPNQINLQVPDDANTGTVPVVVTTAAGSATANVTLAAVAPAFLLYDNKHVAGIILRQDGSGAHGEGANSFDYLGPTGDSLGFATVAAKSGDIVELYATGFGPTNPAVPSGQLFSGAAQAVDAVSVTIDNWNVTPMWAGLSGAGLVQINLTIPGGLSTGDVPLVATVGGAPTPSVVVISLQ